ncbi:hypothetical protein V8C44DRAFT_71731 [Trichoderma aethiopicum]
MHLPGLSTPRRSVNISRVDTHKLVGNECRCQNAPSCGTSHETDACNDEMFVPLYEHMRRAAGQLAHQSPRIARHVRILCNLTGQESARSDASLLYGTCIL